jgi:geranylgeranyl transferase type-2 subunit alpha
VLANPPLRLLKACLLENPKSYSTWHHRKWVVLKGYADLAAELKLVGRCGARGPARRSGSTALVPSCDLGSRPHTTATSDRMSPFNRLPSRSALEQDGRNFHAWAYRQFVVKLSSPGVTTQDELAYAGARVAADFSNYSAWHYRTILLHKLYCEEVQTGGGRGGHFWGGGGKCRQVGGARRGAGRGAADGEVGQEGLLG